nr:MAG TPA: hypothetical protein [Caudoviricetes sp.]
MNGAVMGRTEWKEMRWKRSRHCLGLVQHGSTRRLGTAFRLGQPVKGDWCLMVATRFMFFVAVRGNGRCAILTVTRFGLVLNGSCWLGLVIGCEA